MKNESSAVHTPTPWRLARYMSDTKRYIIAGEILIADCYPDSADRYDVPEDYQANAELIVRAVNCHAELVQLLGDLGQWLEVNLKRGNINAGTANRDGDFVSQIRAALGRAQS